MKEIIKSFDRIFDFVIVIHEIIFTFITIFQIIKFKVNITCNLIL